jgi:hypothetical protein
MDQYIGLPIRLSMKDKSSIEGIVSSIDTTTQILTLIQSRIKSETGSWRSMERVHAKGQDIKDLEILPKGQLRPAISPAPIDSAIIQIADSEKGKKKSVTKISVEDLESGLQQKKQAQVLSDPAILQTSIKKKSGRGSIVGCLDEDFKRLDLDSLASQSISSEKPMVGINQHKVSIWSQDDVKAFKTQGDFDFEASLSQFDKKKHYEEFREKLEMKRGKTTLAAVNKPIDSPSKPFTLDRLASTDTCNTPTLSSISPNLLQKVVLYATNKWGPNTVQMIENATRSIVDLVHSLTMSSSSDECALLLVGSHKVGAIGMAVGRHLVNRGNFSNVLAMIPEDVGSIGMDMTEDTLDASLSSKSSSIVMGRSKKAYLFQKEISGRHGVKMFGQEMDLMTEITGLLQKGKRFSLIIDALTGYEIETSQGQKKQGHKQWSASFQRWFAQTLCPENAPFTPCILSIHQRTKYFNQGKLSHLAMLGLPCKSSTSNASSDDEIFSIVSVPNNAIQGRTFVVDIGISPLLWTKFGSEESNTLSDGLSNLGSLYSKSSFVEISQASIQSSKQLQSIAESKPNHLSQGKKSVVMSFGSMANMKSSSISIAKRHHDHSS